MELPEGDSDAVAVTDTDGLEEGEALALHEEVAVSLGNEAVADGDADELTLAL